MKYHARHNLAIDENVNIMMSQSHSYCNKMKSFKQKLITIIRMISYHLNLNSKLLFL